MQSRGPATNEPTSVSHDSSCCMLHAAHARAVRRAHPVLCNGWAQRLDGKLTPENVSAFLHFLAPASIYLPSLHLVHYGNALGCLH